MRKLGMLTLGAVVALAMAGDAFAQTGTISASATVNAVFDVEATQDLVFAEVNPGTNAVVAVQGTGDGTPGYVEFRFNANYNVTASLPTTLTHTAEPTATLTAAWSCGTSVGTGIPALTGEACSTGWVHSNSTVVAAGTIVIWLGGEIDTTDALVGSYESGDLTFTIAAL